MWYAELMKMKTQNKKLERLIEQKILEFLGDPDNKLSLKKSYLAMLRKRMRKSQKLTSNSIILKKYGIA